MTSVLQENDTMLENWLIKGTEVHGGAKEGEDGEKQWERRLCQQPGSQMTWISPSSCASGLLWAWERGEAPCWPHLGPFPVC